MEITCATVFVAILSAFFDLVSDLGIAYATFRFIGLVTAVAVLIFKVSESLGAFVYLFYGALKYRNGVAPPGQPNRFKRHLKVYEETARTWLFLGFCALLPMFVVITDGARARRLFYPQALDGFVFLHIIVLCVLVIRAVFLLALCCNQYENLQLPRPRFAWGARENIENADIV